MGTDKRERQKANKAARLAAEQAAATRQRRIQTARNLVIAAVVIVVAMLLISALSGCGSSGGDGAAKVDSSAATETSTASGAASCRTSDNGKTAVIDFDAAPKMRIDPAKTYTATVKTSEGTVTLALDTDRTPKTVNNFVALAENCYFDGTALFRTEAQTGIIQGGSPHTQDNSDQGPGYTIPDEGVPFSADDYAPGAIAMANTGQPNSASAQFFFLANDGGRYLADSAQIGPSAGSYVVFGKASKGLDVLQKIAALDDGSGKPSKPVTIESVTIDES